LKILIITPRIPYPPFRGDKLKIFNLAKQLSKNNSVTILTFLRRKNQTEDIKIFKGLGIKIITVKFSVFNSMLKVIGNLFSSLPFQAAYYSSGKMTSKLAELKENNYDVIYYHLVRTAQYYKPEDNNRSNLNILDFTDAMSLYLKRFTEIEKNPIKCIFLKSERNRMEKYEKIAEKFHTLFICSEVDKNHLLQNGLNTKIQILQNGVDIENFKFEEIDYNRNKIIFTGNMPYYANYDAASFFTEKIFPEILKKKPDAKFYIVGQKPARKIRNYSSDNIIVTGYVDDIRREYLTSCVNVAPMRFGAGTLNKIIESIALGVPVVATSLAVQGLPKEINDCIFIADDEAGFAEKVVSILDNPDKAREKVKEGRSLIKNMLSWEKIVRDFEDYLKNEVHRLKATL